HSDFDGDGNKLPYFSPTERLQDLQLTEADLCDEQKRCATTRLIESDRDQRPESPQRLALLQDLYARGATELDSRLGELFAALKARNLWEEALIVVIADHGEEFREHGKFLHSQVFEESLRVPLLMHWPGRIEPAVDTHLVGLESVAPTLLRAVGTTPPPLMEARDLLAALRPEEAAGGQQAMHVSQDKLARTRFGLRTQRYLLVWDFADKSAKLFDRQADPGEVRDLAAQLPDVLADLRSRLFSALRHFRSTRPGLSETSPDVFSEAERKTLRSLGYL
ncbi:MAG: sulfatase-like hydrolase/transferase, partial [Thermoanaerobaculia bacterium]